VNGFLLFFILPKASPPKDVIERHFVLRKGLRDCSILLSSRSGRRLFRIRGEEDRRVPSGRKLFRIRLEEERRLQRHRRSVMRAFFFFHKTMLEGMRQLVRRAEEFALYNETVALQVD